MTAQRQFTFVMEQTLGHVAFAKNVRRVIEDEPGVDVRWLEIPVGFQRWWESLPAIRSNWSLRGSLKARSAIAVDRRRNGGPPALYLFHTQTVSLLSAGWLRQAPPVIVSLDATPLNYDRVGRAYGHATGGTAAERLKFELNRRAFRSAAFLVTWSDWARRSLVEDYGIDAQKIEVIPPGTELELWRRQDDRKPGNRTRLLFVGGDFRRKGGELLHDVFRRHFADTCELHLVTKADVPAGANVFVHRGLPPNSPELRRLVAASDVFVLPTEGDVHSIASIEAMAAGLPVVATDVGAIPEVVVDGETGFLVRPGDGAAVREALDRLIADEGLRRRMGERGRERAAALFDARTNGRRLLARCERVAGA